VCESVLFHVLGSIDISQIDHDRTGHQVAQTIKNERERGRCRQALRRYRARSRHYLITRKLALMFGGDMTVTSELGKGSAFTVRLPSGATQ
jgi:hypothetical protein